MRHSVVVLLAILACALPCLAQPLPVVSSVTLQDAEGQPLIGRVVVTAERETGPDAWVGFTDAAGVSDLAGAPTGVVTLQAYAGIARTLESRQVVHERTGGETLAVTLPYVLNMRALGYFAGDAHLHSNRSDGNCPPEQTAWHCRGEGLDWAFLTDHGTTEGYAAFRDARAPGLLALCGEEVTTGVGHFPALGLTSTVAQSPCKNRADIARIWGEVRAQGGLVTTAHPMVPMMGFRDWDLESPDLIEIFNGSLPPYKMPFDRLQARLKWHSLLSEGRRLAAVGNSDCHDDFSGIALAALRDPEAAIKREPLLGILWNTPSRDTVLVPWVRKGIYLGAYQTCVKVAELTGPAVLEALKAGRSFVTNGPVVVATVNGVDPGSEIRAGTAALHYQVACNRGLARLDVVVDGGAAASVSLEGLQASEGTLEFTVPAGARWVTVECVGTWPDFATTNAWYVAG